MQVSLSPRDWASQSGSQALMQIYFSRSLQHLHVAILISFAGRKWFHCLSWFPPPSSPLPPSRFFPQEFVLELCETCHLNNYLICMAATARNALKCKLKRQKKIQMGKIYKLESKVLQLISGCVSEKFKLIAPRFVEQINPICSALLCEMQNRVQLHLLHFRSFFPCLLHGIFSWFDSDCLSWN